MTNDSLAGASIDPPAGMPTDPGGAHLSEQLRRLRAVPVTPAAEALGAAGAELQRAYLTARIARGRELKALIDQATEELDTIKSEIRELMPHGTVDKVTGVKVGTVPLKWSPARAREVLSPEKYAAICEPVPSRELAERVLTGDELDACKVPNGKPSVTL